MYCLASLRRAHRKHAEGEGNICYGFLQIADALTCHNPQHHGAGPAKAFYIHLKCVRCVIKGSVHGCVCYVYACMCLCCTCFIDVLSVHVLCVHVCEVELVGHYQLWQSLMILGDIVGSALGILARGQGQFWQDINLKSKGFKVWAKHVEGLPWKLNTLFCKQNHMGLSKDEQEMGNGDGPSLCHFFLIKWSIW